MSSHAKPKRLHLRRVKLDDLGGRKGQLTQRPALLGAVRGAAAHHVLSEGEQTALGLAGFFTEAKFDNSKSAIFDDPVTSLDHVRQDKVAQRLAQLARTDKSSCSPTTSPSSAT
jgi:ABC-type hemin transport system ATPase subunit